MTSSSIENHRSRIQILPEDIANKIAAGEVIERPASVIKELVENSIDAGATRIAIEIEGAGKELIRVSDNGQGMVPDDAQRAFERHATSKISRASDLEGILTLGFRGEALPSIASVSQACLITSRNEQDGATEIIVEGGSFKSTRSTSRPRGTTLEIKQLFFNTPARRKFLKRDTTETTHIIQGITQQALVNPQIHFTMTHNGRQILNVLATDHLQYRIAELLGSELAREVLPVEADDGRYRLEGFVSKPVFTRSNASSQYFYVNGRFIRDKVILHAIQHGYRHLLPKGQYPVLVLKLFLDPTLVDVNVHPTKAEVRFAFQQEVHQFVSHAIQETLKQNSMEPAATSSEPFRKDSKKYPFNTNFAAPDLQGKSLNTSMPKDTNTQRSFDISGKQAFDSFYGGAQGNSNYPSDQSQRFGRFEGKPIPVSNLIYSDFEPLGQLESSFIVLQGKGGILIVDQHIAHERILYERFHKAAQSRNIEIQQLLFPVAMEFSPSEVEILAAQRELLGDLGLDLEPFGRQGYLLRAVPAILKNDHHEKLIRDVIEELRGNRGVRSIQEKYEELVIMMSCRNAIKINHPLDLNQIRKLIFDLEQTEMPFTCPHGRPIAILIEIDAILKRFLRK